MAGLGQLLKALALLIPLPVLIGLAAVGGVFFGPAWLESARQKQLRGWVRRLVRAEPQERRDLEAQILTWSGDNAGRWSTVADAADHYGQPALRDLAISRLEALGAKDLVRKWKDKDKRESGRARDPIQALVRIEALYKNGRTDLADEQLAEARAAFPGDPDLDALAAKQAAKRAAKATEDAESEPSA